MKEKERQFDSWQPLIFAALVAIGMFIGTRLDDQLPDDMPLVFKRATDFEHLEHAVDAIRYIQNRYGEELDDEALAQKTIEDLIDGLDPHSYYLSGYDYRYFKERQEGSYDGIGIDYETLEDTINIFRIYPASPAEEAGMQSGDMILQIDGQAVSGADLESLEVYEIWRQAGNEFTIQVYSPRNGQTENVDLKKRTIELNSIPAAFRLDDETGYIKIERFSNDTPRRFVQALQEVIGQQKRDLIIDVRNNPGGNLQGVVEILDQLISEKDELLVYMDGKHLKKTEYRSTGKILFPVGNIVVLVNEHSVSASEVLAGSLQDLDRATIVGRRTFGKALVQEMYELGNQSAINLTVGKYYMPSGRFIQKPYEKKSKYEEEVDKRTLNGELACQDTTNTSQDSPYLSKSGRVMQAGVGVVPDICVPTLGITYNKAWRPLEKRFFKTIFNFFISNRAATEQAVMTGHLHQLDISETITDFITSDSTATSLLSEYGEAFSEMIQHEGEATLVWLVSGDEAYYRYNAKNDSEIQKGLEVLKNNSNSKLTSHKDQL